MLRHRYQGIIVSLWCFFSFVFCACEKIQPEDFFDPTAAQIVVDALNNCVESFVGLTKASIDEKTVIAFLSKPNGSYSSFQIFQIHFDDELFVDIPELIQSDKCFVPELSVAEEMGHYYWVLNGGWVFTNKGEKARVTEKEHLLHFFVSNESIIYTIGSNSDVYEVSEGEQSNAKIVDISYDTDSNKLQFLLPTQTVFSFPLYSRSSVIQQNVKNEVYYKDVFLDAGVGLTSRKALYAAKALGLSLEGMSFSRNADVPEEITLQQSVIAGSNEDANGRLLYPDGQPRFKLLFVNGGNSRLHGESLGVESRSRMKDFISNGGSYVGTCAGAFFASSGYDSNLNYANYLHIWPGVMNHTGIVNSATDMTIEPNSPLLDYYNFGGDLYIADVRHNKGGFPVSLPDGTEVLARYYCPDNSYVHQKPSIWAYKADGISGRVVMEGSHPEEVSQGERLELTSAMMLYAIEGRGIVSIKGILKNGVERVMNGSSGHKNPDYARIGDMQCHHFAVFIPSNSRNVSFKVDSDDDCDLVLRLNRNSYAFPSNAEFVSGAIGNHQQLNFQTYSSGITYISVQCVNAPTIEQTYYGQQYVGRTDMLNGYSYSVVVSWTETE